MPRENLYPALVEKFCRICGKRAEVEVASRNHARNFYYCSKKCELKRKKIPLDPHRPCPKILKSNIRTSSKFNGPKQRKYYQEKKEKIVVQPSNQVPSRDDIYFIELRKHYGLSVSP